MTRTKHLFRQDAPCLRYVALGDSAVRIIALHHLIAAHDLDAIIVPPAKPEFHSFWTDVFGPDRVILDPERIPPSHALAKISSPTPLDWQYGAAAWNVFESVMWESGFFHTQRLRITPPLVFQARHRAPAAMIYPAEATDGNRVYDSQWWIRSCASLRALGYGIHCLGLKDHPPLREFFETVKFDGLFPPTLQGLRECVAESSVAIGSSTGPTWALLMSDIPQIVLESKKSPHGYWHFDRCQTVLTKRLRIVSTLECLIPALVR